MHRVEAAEKSLRRVGRFDLILVGLVVGLILTPAARAEDRELDRLARATAKVEELRAQDRHGDDETAADSFAKRYSPTTFERLTARRLAELAVLENQLDSSISPDEMQAELDRMARHSRRPKRLAALFAALSRDPDLIAEVLARPHLVDRKLRAVYEGRTDQAETYDAWLDRATAAQGAASGGIRSKASGLVLPKILGEGTDEPDSWTRELPAGPPAKRGQSSVWTGSELIVWGGVTPGVPTAGLWTNAGFAYDPTTDTWSSIRLDGNTPEPRAFHSAVWTGTKMIIWGGESWDEEAAIPYYVALDTGGVYDPVDDSWVATPQSADTPSARLEHVAVWTGSAMVVWGGLVPGAPADPPEPVADYTPLDDGAIYDPDFGGWTPMGGSPPTARGRAAAVWSGDEVWVVGGFDGTSWLKPSMDGTTFSGYDPSTDTWDTVKPQPPSGMPPYEAPRALFTGESLWVTQPSSGKVLSNFDGAVWSEPIAMPPSDSTRRYASLVWTGRRLLVWGGIVGMAESVAGDGLIYDTRNDVWTSLAIDPGVSPAPRFGHVGIWTGADMLIWGGGSLPDPTYGPGRPLNTTPTGRRLVPAWDGPSDSGTWTAMPNPPIAGSTGQTMVWTGSEMIVWGGRLGEVVQDGVVYDPATDQWSSTSLTDAPVARSGHTAVWTGDEMVIWGGRTVSETVLDTGGRYDPVADIWTATGGSPPASRDGHSAVWTGSEMLIWGGFGATGDSLDTGALYDPVGNAWTATGGSPPTARGSHSAVWTSDAMAIFGGLIGCPGACTPTNDAAVYDPDTDTWGTAFTNLANDGERWAHSAVWTGDAMLVWGGTGTYDDANTCLNDGLSIDPTGSTITDLGAVGDTRCRHSAIWNGAEMIVWGGVDRINLLTTGGVVPETARSSGGRFEPATETWTPTPDDNTTIPGTQLHTAVWTGEEMLVWGGRPEISGSLGVYFTDTAPTSSPQIAVDGVPGSTVLLGGAAEVITLGHTLATALFDDVEGEAQWTVGTKAGTADWHVAVAGACAAQGDYSSPVSAWRFGTVGTCNYQGAEGGYTLTSIEPFEITSSTLLELRYFLETDRVANAAEQDTAYIEVSADDGSSWTTVAIDLEHWFSAGPSPEPLEATGDTWRGLSIALAPYVGTTPADGRVRFVFERLGSLNDGVGWVIDDISIGEPAGDGRIPFGTLVASDGSSAEHRVGAHDQWDRPRFSWDLDGDGLADNLDVSLPGFTLDETDLADYGQGQPGQYDLTLTVTDSNGRSDVATVTLEVVDGEPPTVEVLSPNGGEAWSAGSTRTITWSAADNVGLGGFEVAYYDDEAGTGPTTITCPETLDGDARSCTWTLPAATSTAVRVEVTAHDQRPMPGGPNTASDTSDSPFYVIQANSDEIRTLVVWHRDRIESRFGTSEAGALGGKLATFASHVKVDGQVLDLANVPSLAPLYATWDATAWTTGTTDDLDGDIAAANNVATGIRTYLFEQISQSFTHLEYLVLVGADSSIPFWRMQEDLPRYPESTYIEELQSFGLLDDASSLAAFCDETESPLMATFCRDRYLADTPYGASQTTTVPGSSFTWWLPDLAVGRLVETPAQMTGLIDVFIAQDGVTVVDQALTTGYDFLTDGGDAVHSLLQTDLDLGEVTLNRLSQSVSLWTDDDLSDQLFGVAPTEPTDLAFVSGHADHRAEGAAQVGDAGVLTTEEMAAVGLYNRGAMLVGVGCHSGVSVEPGGGASDETDPAFLLDLPELLAGRSFPVLIGNGGYGWGLSEGVGLGEQLVLLVAEELTAAGQISLGEALRLAKQEYFLRQSRLDAFDHKVIHEAMLFGIPNYEARVPQATGASRPEIPSLGEAGWDQLDLGSHGRVTRSPLREAANPSADDAGTAKGASTLRILDFTYQAYESGQDTDNDPDTADWQEAYAQFDWCTDADGESLLCTGAPGEEPVGTYFTLDGVASSESGRPIQPMISFDSRLFGTELHGVLIRGGEVIQPALINPEDPAQCTDDFGTVHPCFDPVVGNPESEEDEPEGPAPSPYINLDRPTPYINLDRPTSNGFIASLNGGNSRFDTLNAPMGVTVRRGTQEMAPGEFQEIYSEWLYRTREFTNYYSTSTDWQAPEFGAYSADCDFDIVGDDCFHVIVGTIATFDVPVTDDGDGVYRVFVTYTEDVDTQGLGAWQTVELEAIAPDRWGGSLPLSREAHYFVQAVDWAGNVGVVLVSGDDVDADGNPIGSAFDAPRLFTIELPALPIFEDGFESGDTSAWSAQSP